MNHPDDPPEISIEEGERLLDEARARREALISRAINFAHASMRPDAEVQSFLDHECKRLEWYCVIPDGCVGCQPCGANTDGATLDLSRLSYFLQTGKDEFYPWQAQMRRREGRG